MPAKPINGRVPLSSRKGRQWGGWPEYNGALAQQAHKRPIVRQQDGYADVGVRGWGLPLGTNPFHGGVGFRPGRRFRVLGSVLASFVIRKTLIPDKKLRNIVGHFASIMNVKVRSWTIIRIFDPRWFHCFSAENFQVPVIDRPRRTARHMPLAGSSPYPALQVKGLTGRCAVTPLT